MCCSAQPHDAYKLHRDGDTSRTGYVHLAYYSYSEDLIFRCCVRVLDHCKMVSEGACFPPHLLRRTRDGWRYMEERIKEGFNMWSNAATAYQHRNVVGTHDQSHMYDWWWCICASSGRVANWVCHEEEKCILQWLFMWRV